MPDQPIQPSIPQSIPKSKRKVHRLRKVKRLPPFNVVLIDDDDHTYDYVITMLARVFSHPIETGFLMADMVDNDGRAIVFTGHLELAELKRDQILSFGPDPMLKKSKGSMRAVIEAAG